MAVQFEIELLAPACEGYPSEGQPLEAVIEEGNFQWCTPIVKRYRTVELNEEGEETGYGEWITPEKEIRIWGMRQ